MNRQPSKQLRAKRIAVGREQFLRPLGDSEALRAGGFEEALIGHTHGSKGVAVYDYDVCVQVLMERDSMTIEDAVEWMEYNVVGSYVGDKTPVFISLG